MYFAGFTVSHISPALLCDSVFASHCGKHDIAMIVNAFQRAQNTTAGETTLLISQTTRTHACAHTHTHALTHDSSISQGL